MFFFHIAQYKNHRYCIIEFLSLVSQERRRAYNINQVVFWNLSHCYAGLDSIFYRYQLHRFTDLPSKPPAKTPGLQERVDSMERTWECGGKHTTHGGFFPCHGTHFFFRRISDSTSLETSYVCCQRQCAGTLPPWKQMSRIWWLLWQSFSAFGSTSVWACCLTIILSLPTQFIDLTGISWNEIFFRQRVCFWVVDFQCGALQCRVQIRDNVGAKLWAIIPNLMIYKRLRLHWDFLGIPELKLLLWL